MNEIKAEEEVEDKRKFYFVCPFGNKEKTPLIKWIMVIKNNVCVKAIHLADGDDVTMDAERKGYAVPDFTKWCDTLKSKYRVIQISEELAFEILL